MSVCFCGLLASKNLNKPQGPKNCFSSGELLLLLLGAGFGVGFGVAEFVAAFELTEFVEVFAEGVAVVVPEVEIVPPVDINLIKTPLPPP